MKKRPLIGAAFLYLNFWHAFASVPQSRRPEAWASMV